MRQRLIGGFIPSLRCLRQRKHLVTSFASVRRNGVGQRMAEKYLARAREVIKADYSIERSDFLGSRLALLDKIIQASIASKQHSNALGL